MAARACLKNIFRNNPPRVAISHPYTSSNGESHALYSLADLKNYALNAFASCMGGAEGSNNMHEQNIAKLLTYLAGASSLAATVGLLMKDPKSCYAHCEATRGLDQQTLVPSSSAVDSLKSSNFLLTDAYRRRVFFKYERRIRMRSPPEKVFDYFASIRSSNGQSFMTAGDLIRAVVPVFPPSESTLVREGFLPGERPPGELHCPSSKFFMLFDTNGDGLISFPEYIFFVTLLSIPESNFRAAFKMFDLDGNGMIEKEEFKKVMGVMRSRTRQGIAQRDGLRTGLKVEHAVENGGIVELFFGKDGKKHLRHEDFELFLKDLHEEIIRLEFLHYDYLQQGTICVRDFGLSMVAAADMSHINQYLDRVDALSEDAFFKHWRISFEEFHNFAELRKKLQPLALAICSYGETYGLLTKADFQRAASQVCKIPISKNVVDIIFYIFDTNGDGNLSMEEFLGVLERRERDIAEPRESGLIYFLKCWWSCAQNCRDQSQWLYI